MKNFYLFEAGASKTAFIHVDDGEMVEQILPAYNPNRKYDAFEIAVQEGINILPNADIIFYGSGLANEKNKLITQQLFDCHSPKSIKVYDDILGAARALYGTESGVFCVMGTGGLAAVYDGRKVIERRGGYGYLIDDLGGGYELGKRFIAAWLNDDLSKYIDTVLVDDLRLDKTVLLQRIYSEHNLDLISSLVPTIALFSDDEVIQQLLSDYFDDFLKYQVKPLCIKHEQEQFSVVGSIGFVFYKELKVAAKKVDLKLNQCIQSPIQRLLKYHL